MRTKLRVLAANDIAHQVLANHLLITTIASEQASAGGTRVRSLSEIEQPYAERTVLRRPTG